MTRFSLWSLDNSRTAMFNWFPGSRRDDAEVISGITGESVEDILKTHRRPSTTTTAQSRKMRRDMVRICRPPWKSTKGKVRHEKRRRQTSKELQILRDELDKCVMTPKVPVDYTSLEERVGAQCGCCGIIYPNYVWKGANDGS